MTAVLCSAVQTREKLVWSQNAFSRPLCQSCHDCCVIAIGVKFKDVTSREFRVWVSFGKILCSSAYSSRHFQQIRCSYKSHFCFANCACILDGFKYFASHGLSASFSAHFVSAHRISAAGASARRDCGCATSDFWAPLSPFSWPFSEKSLKISPCDSRPHVVAFAQARAGCAESVCGQGVLTREGRCANDRPNTSHLVSLSCNCFRRVIASFTACCLILALGSQCGGCSIQILQFLTLCFCFLPCFEFTIVFMIGMTELAVRWPMFDSCKYVVP